MTSFSTKCVGLKFLILFASAMPTCVFAVTENSNGDAGKRGISTTLKPRMQKAISVDFRNTPIEDVIRILADQADVDIIKGSKVTGNVTAKLTDVPLAEALDTILASHGYDYILGKNMIRIASLEELTEETERLISRIYRITYADVAQVEKALTPLEILQDAKRLEKEGRFLTGLMKFISKRGSLSASPVRNRQADDTSVEEQQISNRASLGTSPVRNRRADASSVQEQQISNRASNIIVTDTESKIRAIDAFIEEIDRQPR